MDEDDVLAQKYASVLPQLDERQRRVVLAAEARALGRGGISRVARAAGVSRPTIRRGLRELDQRAPPGRVRQPGGGRHALPRHDPQLLAALASLVEPDTRGDPQSPLCWTCKSTRQLAAALTAQGHPVSAWTVRHVLHAAGYSLQVTAKTREGSRHPDRDAQFRYLNEQSKQFLAQGLPVISVDTKKKELVGVFKNPGREWQPAGQPEHVNVHDFLDPALGKAIPYGIYDVGRNTGWVTVGQDHDTASFAVASMQHWWDVEGRAAYPAADQLLISADSGGSNGYRLRLWKVELQHFADRTGLRVTVCHLPPGTSKWNKVEHRLFAQISVNWRGRPLVSHEVIVKLIGATTTQTGLRVRAERDQDRYPTHVKVSDAALAAVRLTPHAFHGTWNYTITPTSAPTGL